MPTYKTRCSVNGILEGMAGWQAKSKGVCPALHPVRE